MDIDVGLAGDLFTAKLDMRIAAGTERAKVAVAGYGLNLLSAHSVLFRYDPPPTEPGHPGFWQRQLRSDRVADDIVLSDRAVYTAWLEGVGSRNATSRFKGYRMWQRSTQQLQDRAGDIAGPVIARAIDGQL